MLLRALYLFDYAIWQIRMKEFLISLIFNFSILKNNNSYLKIPIDSQYHIYFWSISKD